MEQETSFNETVLLPIKPNVAPKKSLVDGLGFDILIFRPEGKQPGALSVGAMREYLTRFGNVSIYDAGFRLPYYGSGQDKTGQDWLNVALDQGRRLSAAEWLPARLKPHGPYMQNLPAPGRLLGAVRIDTNHERSAALLRDAAPGEWLQIQSSRDRLHNNPAFLQLRDLVRFSLDFYASRYTLLALQAVEKHRDKEPTSRKFDRALTALEAAKGEMRPATYRDVRRELTDAHKATTTEEESLDRRAALLAPLATAGMTALALNHELAREARFLTDARDKILRLADRYPDPELSTIATELANLCDRLDALQQLFEPLLSDTDATATDRLRVRSLIDQVARSMRPLVPRLVIDTTGVSSSLRFPVGSFAEWSAVLQNIIANAWNATLDVDWAELVFEGNHNPNGREWLRANDNGRGLGMSLDDSTKMFDAFERRLPISHENRSLAIGGHGLGLTIVRMIANRRGVTVRFASPQKAFSTTFEMLWRGPTK